MHTPAKLIWKLMRISFSYKFSKSSLKFMIHSTIILNFREDSFVSIHLAKLNTVLQLGGWQDIPVAWLLVCLWKKGKKCKSKGKRYTVCAICQVLTLHAAACILYHLIFSLSHKIDALMIPILWKGRITSKEKLLSLPHCPSHFTPGKAQHCLELQWICPTWKSGSTESDLSARLKPRGKHKYSGLTCSHLKICGKGQ